MRTTPEHLDVAQSLLDRQVVDAEGALVCKVDDIELVERGDRLVLTTILEGPAALGPRLDEPLGRWLVAIWRRLSKGDGPGRIALLDVGHLDSAIHLSHAIDDNDKQGLERWTQENIIRKIPGARDEP